MSNNYCIETSRTWKIFGTLLYIVKIVVPLLIIGLCIMKLITVVQKGDADSISVAVRSMITKIIIAILIFIIPTIINTTFDMLINDNSKDKYGGCTSCLLNPNDGECDILIEEYENSRKELEKEDNPVIEGNIQTGDLTDAKKKKKKKKSSNYGSTYNDSNIGNKTDLNDISNAVGICYSTWFNPIYKNARLISSGHLKANQFYYWGEPALGFYSSNDKGVIEQHMKMFNEAQIDFIIIDNTNVQKSWKSGNYWKKMVSESMKSLLDKINEMNSSGIGTPKVVNWINTNNGTGELKDIYNEFYQKEAYSKLWLYYEGKPLILTTSSTSTSLPVTIRKMWGLQTSLQRNEWSFLQLNNDKPSYNSSGQIEQIGVTTASQATYMSVTSTAKGRRGGRTFNEQWQVAFKYKPKVVTITWWNEWAAQNLNGNFTDLYNQEYSRDIEPMKGGHGDTYYNWMKEYISAYKNNQSCPYLVSN